MSSKLQAELIDPKTAGGRRLQLRAPVFDEDALARVDSALESMSGSFKEWLNEEIERLHQARLHARASAWSLDALSVMASASHDLKGVAGMYGYPIITQFAASLYRLLDAEEGKIASAEHALAEAHIDAIRVAARDEITTEANPVGRQVLAVLRQRIDDLGIARE
jgi:chemotaxis protein histidine kinase CheA